MRVLKDEYTYRVFGRHAIIEEYDPLTDTCSYVIARLSYRRSTRLYTFKTYQRASQVFGRM